MRALNDGPLGAAGLDLMNLSVKVLRCMANSFWGNIGVTNSAGWCGERTNTWSK
jgi:hypothetical protein